MEAKGKKGHCLAVRQLKNIVGLNVKRGIMKKWILLLILPFLFGCEEKPDFGPPISRLQSGMQQYEVEEIYGSPLTFVSAEPAPGQPGYSVGVYRMWSNRSDDPKSIWGTYIPPKTPYKLSFLYAPPLTMQQCYHLAKVSNITDPNEFSQVMALEGYQLNRLIKVEEDSTAIMIETVNNPPTIQERYNPVLHNIRGYVFP